MFPIVNGMSKIYASGGVMGVLEVQDETLRLLKEIALQKNVPVEGLARQILHEYVLQFRNEGSQKQGREMRRYERQETNWDDKLHFQFAGDSSREKIPGKLKDISMNGLCFSFDLKQNIPDEQFYKNQVLNVSFELPQTGQSIRLQMNPRYIRKQGVNNVVGTAFIEEGCDYGDLIAFMGLLDKEPPSDSGSV